MSAENIAVAAFCFACLAGSSALLGMARSRLDEAVVWYRAATAMFDEASRIANEISNPLPTGERDE